MKNKKMKKLSEGAPPLTPTKFSGFDSLQEEFSYCDENSFWSEASTERPPPWNR
jgi:hypothetical protein